MARLLAVTLSGKHGQGAPPSPMQGAHGQLTQPVTYALPGTQGEAPEAQLRRDWQQAAQPVRVASQSL